MSQSRIIVGDAREKLKELPAGSARCCVTSPPYWGLRDYGTARWDGGDEECDHTAGVGGHLAESAGSTRGGANKVAAAQSVPFMGDCGKCGARRIDSQLGLERTPEEYVAKLVAVFREVRRVLADDGTLWLNLGDSFNSGSGSGNQSGILRYQERHSYADSKQHEKIGRVPTSSNGLKPKDLVGIPWSVAFALRADGWYLRSEIIWAKTAPMPESVMDRPTKSHEQIFLLAKSESYYYDADAIAEPLSYPSGPWGGRNPRSGVDVNGGGQASEEGFSGYVSKGTRNKRTVWTIGPQPFTDWAKSVRSFRVGEGALSDGKSHITSLDCVEHAGFVALASTVLCDEHADVFLSGIERTNGHHAEELEDDCEPIARLHAENFFSDSSDCSRRSRSLTASDRSNRIHRTARALETTRPYTPCGEILRRTERIEERLKSAGLRPDTIWSKTSSACLAGRQWLRTLRGTVDTSWFEASPACKCSFESEESISHFATFPPALVEPCILAGSAIGDTVLDPFCGAGTSGLVASRLHRNFVGVELNPKYAEMARLRIEQDAPLFNEAEVTA